MIKPEIQKPRLAILTSRFPYPLEKGDKLRLYYQICHLHTFFEIDLFVIGDGDTKKEDIQQILPFVQQVFYYRMDFFSRIIQMFTGFWRGLPFQVSFFYEPKIHQLILNEFKKNPPDHIYCQLARMAKYAENTDIPKTLDYMDAFGIGMYRRASVAGFWAKWIYLKEADLMKKYEKKLLSAFDFFTIISEQDKKYILEDSAKNNKEIEVLPNGIDDSFFQKPKIEMSYDLVFVGNMGYLPNIEAAEVLVKQILPLLPKTIKVLIAGARPHKRVTTLQSENVHVSGWFDDIREAYASARIFVAPIWSGTGQQNKILEAMALGLPCVTTPPVNNAILGQDGVNILLASDVCTFVDKINFLLSDDTAIYNIGQQAKIFVKQNFSWKQSVLTLVHIILSTIKK